MHPCTQTDTCMCVPLCTQQHTHRQAVQPVQSHQSFNLTPCTKNFPLENSTTCKPGLIYKQIHVSAVWYVPYNATGGQSRVCCALFYTLEEQQQQHKSQVVIPAAARIVSVPNFPMHVLLLLPLLKRIY